MVAPVGGSGGSSKTSCDRGRSAPKLGRSAPRSAPGSGCPFECGMLAWTALVAVDRLLRIRFLLQVRRAAIVAALYSMCMSVVVAALSAWRISVNAHNKAALQDVYLGVMIAYIAIFCSQMCLAALSVLLLYAIIRELVALVVPWVVGSIAFMSLEAVATVYSNVLRDHVNRDREAKLFSILDDEAETSLKLLLTVCLLSLLLITPYASTSVDGQFDGLFKAEAVFFIVRLLLTMAAMVGVLRFYKKLRAGITWKGPEMVEL